MCAPSASDASSQCSAITTPSKARAYVRALRSTRDVGTQRPSSLNIRTPAATISPISARVSPANPFVIAPTGNTSARPALTARSRTSCTTAALSVTGSVLAIGATAVKPPSAAALVPVSIVSLCSWPGSRRCVCISTRPGAITNPSQSRTSLPEAFTAPTAAISPPSTSTSVVSSRPLAGSTTLAPRKTSGSCIRGAPEQEVQQRHADCDAVRDLVLDHRSRQVGDVGVDLDASVHRPGTHDEGTVRQHADALVSEPDQSGVFPDAGEV